MTIPVDVLAAQNHINSLISDLAGQHEQRLQEIFDETIRGIEAELSTFVQGGTVGGDRFRPIFAAYDLSALGRRLNQAGFGQFQTELELSYQVVIDEILARKYAHLSGALADPGISERALRASLDFDLAEMQRIGVDFIRRLKGQMEQMTVAPITIREAAVQLQAQTGVPLSQAKTAVNTGLGGLQRRLHQETAAALPGPSLFLYAGTVSQRTRPFVAPSWAKSSRLTNSPSSTTGRAYRSRPMRADGTAHTISCRSRRSMCSWLGLRWRRHLTSPVRTRGRDMFVKFTFKLEVNLPTELVSSGYALARATDVIALVRQRVQQRGLNLQDRAMKPYKPSTIRQRKAKGRQTSVRDLTMSGRLMNDIHILRLTQSQGAHFATIGFATGRGRLIALAHQVRDPWFGLSDRDRATAMALVQRTLGPEIQRHLDSPSRSGGS